MDLVRPAMIVSLFLAATTLFYTGQWAGKNPRGVETPEAEAPVATISETAKRAVASR